VGWGLSQGLPCAGWEAASVAQCWCPQGRRLLCPCGCLWLTFFQFSSVPRWRSAAPGEAIFARTTTLFRAYPPWAASPLPRSSAWRGGAVKSVTFRLRNCVQSTRNRLKRRSCQASMCSVCGLGECLIVGSYMCPPPPSTWTILRGAYLGGWAEPTPIEGIVSKYDHT
jgi:hypothetical protein